MKLEDVIDMVVSERKFQVWYGESPSVGEEILLMEEYITRARKEWLCSVGDEEAIKEIVSVVTIGLRCLENHIKEEKE